MHLKLKNSKIWYLHNLYEKDEHSIPLTELEKRLETSAKNGL